MGFIKKPRPPIYGLLAEFDTPESVLAAAHKAYEAGYRKMDAFTPFPIEGLAEAIGFHHSGLPLLVLLGGLTGCAAGFGMQYYASVFSYPFNVAGKPFNSWPGFIPVTFEVTILIAAFSAVLGMLALNRLPQPYHPVFNVPRFAMASRNSFFLCIESSDPKFDRAATQGFLQGLTSLGVYEIEH